MNLEVEEYPLFDEVYHMYLAACKAEALLKVEEGAVGDLLLPPDLEAESEGEEDFGSEGGLSATAEEEGESEGSSSDTGEENNELSGLGQDAAVVVTSGEESEEERAGALVPDQTHVLRGKKKAYRKTTVASVRENVMREARKKKSPPKVNQVKSQSRSTAVREVAAFKREGWC